MGPSTVNTLSKEGTLMIHTAHHLHLYLLSCQKIRHISNCLVIFSQPGSVKLSTHWYKIRFIFFHWKIYNHLFATDNHQLKLLSYILTFLLLHSQFTWCRKSLNAYNNHTDELSFCTKVMIYLFVYHWKPDCLLEHVIQM